MQAMSSMFEIIWWDYQKMFTSEYGGIFTLILGLDTGASSEYRTCSNIVKEGREARGRGWQLLRYYRNQGPLFFLFMEYK